MWACLVALHKSLIAEALGPINYSNERRNPFGMGTRAVESDRSDETSRLIDAEVRKLVEGAQDRARSLVRQNRDVLDLMAAALLKEESLAGDRLADFLTQVRRVELAVG